MFPSSFFVTRPCAVQIYVHATVKGSLVGHINGRLQRSTMSNHTIKSICMSSRLYIYTMAHSHTYAFIYNHIGDTETFLR